MKVSFSLVVELKVGLEVGMSLPSSLSFLTSLGSSVGEVEVGIGSRSTWPQESLTQPKQARMKGRQLPQDHPDYSMVAAV